MAIASLVLGIISVVFFFVPFYGWIGIIFGVVGIILGAMGQKDPEKKGIATAGLVLSIVGAVLGLVIYLACVACVSSAVNETKNLFDGLIP